jgi:hypothetical protein
VTKSERLLLERIYAEMLPAEQQELGLYIQKKFGKQQDKPVKAPDSTPEADKQPEPETEAQSESEDIIDTMEKKKWAPPSKKLMNTLSKIRKAKSPEEK